MHNHARRLMQITEMMQESPLAFVHDSASNQLDRIIANCLEKDSQDRYQHAAQIVVDLRKLRRVTDSGVQAVQTSGPITAAQQAATSGPVTAPAKAAGGRNWGGMIAVVALTAIALGWIAWVQFGPQPGGEARPEAPGAPAR